MGHPGCDPQCHETWQGLNSLTRALSDSVQDRAAAEHILLICSPHEVCMHLPVLCFCFQQFLLCFCQLCLSSGQFRLAKDDL